MSTEIRIGDAERETAATALGEHYATGRLSKEEYEERAGRVWAARFQSDLEPLFADLPNPWRRAPAEVRTVQPRPAMPIRPPVRAFVPVAPLLVVGVVAMAILTGMPWLLFGLFWLCAFAGGGRRQARTYPYR